MTRRIASAAVVMLLIVAVAAVAPVGAVQSDATPTPQGAETTAQTATPTPTPTDTQSSGDGGDDPSTTARDAQLTITQPGYVDSPVQQSSQNGTLLYQASGEQLLITVDNVDVDVQNYGVRESEATLTRQGDTYVLRPDADGTYSVWWTTGDGTTYEAFVQVETAAYAHVPQSQYDDQTAKADAWSEFVGKLEEHGIADGSESRDELLHIAEEAVAWYEFYLNPLASLSGGFIAIVTILATQPGGWLFLALLFLVVGLSTYTIVKRNRRLERQFRDIEDLDEAERKAWEQEIKRAASKDTLQDWGLTDADAEAIKQHTGARNPRQFAAWIADNIGELRVIRTLLGAYEQLGHRLEVRRTPEGDVMSVDLVYRDGDDPPDADDVAADGGGGEDVSYEFVRPTEASKDVLKRLSWDRLEGDVLWHPDVDTARLDLPVQNDRHSDGFDLIEEADIPIGEDGADHYILERREEFVDILIEIVEEAAASTYTDEDGRPRPEVDFVEMVYQFVSVGSEMYRLPFWHLRDVLLATRGQLDDDERLDQLATKSEDNEL